MKRPKLILVDKNHTFRQRLAFLMNVDQSFEIIGAVSTGEELIEFLTHHHPDFLLIDVDIPHLKGIQVVRKAMKLFPGLKIFAFTQFEDDNYIIHLLKAGVKGFILKSSAIYELDKDIHSLLTDVKYRINNHVINLIKKSNAKDNQIPKEPKQISSRAGKFHNRLASSANIQT